MNTYEDQMIDSFIQQRRRHRWRLYYYNARWYDPRSGRFVTKDPIGFGGGDTNQYRYVRNNAANAIDPTGLRIRERGEVSDENKGRPKKLLEEAAKRDDDIGCIARWALHPGTTVTINWRDPSDPRFNEPHGKNNLAGHDRVDHLRGEITLPNSPNFLGSGVDPGQFNMDGLGPDQQANAVLFHEIGHALIGLNDPTPETPGGGNVTLCENPARRASGAKDDEMREDYDGTPVPGRSDVDAADKKKYNDFIEKAKRLKKLK